MKHILTLILISLSTLVFSQDYTITFLVEFKKTTNSASSRSNIPPPPVPPPFYTRLQVKDGQTIYHEYMDVTIVSKQGKDEEFTEYSKIQSKEITRTCSLIKGKGVKIQKINNWKINKAAIDINGMKAYLATSIINDNGKDQLVKAYFVPQLKTPAGPSIYCGLPGLVVQVELPNKKISLVSLSKESINDFNYDDVSTIEIIDQSNFKQERITALRNNFTSILEKRKEHQRLNKEYEAK